MEDVDRCGHGSCLVCLRNSLFSSRAGHERSCFWPSQRGTSAVWRQKMAGESAGRGWVQGVWPCLFTFSTVLTRPPAVLCGTTPRPWSQVAHKGRPRWSWCSRVAWRLPNSGEVQCYICCASEVTPPCDGVHMSNAGSSLQVRSVSFVPRFISPSKSSHARKSLWLLRGALRSAYVGIGIACVDQLRMVQHPSFVQAIGHLSYTTHYHYAE